MAVSSPSRLSLSFAVAGIWIVLDQATKYWAEAALADGPRELFWTLRLRLVFNTGASFSMAEGFGPWIGVVALVVVGVLMWSGRQVTSATGAIGLGLVLGGAVGNILDRAFRSSDGFLGGAVIDFIDFQWWPVFNVADVGVVVGAALVVISGVQEEIVSARAARRHDSQPGAHDASSAGSGTRE